jgi:hypothetical protein
MFYVGAITASELYSALRWMGLEFSVQEVHDLIRKIATELEGAISYKDFKRVFHDMHGDDNEAAHFKSLASLGSPRYNSSEQIPLIKIPEIFEQTQVCVSKYLS